MKYTVSVRLMTYNHSAFIRQAMEGILIQSTNFPVELVIGDDFSTDNTLDIIRSYSSTQNIDIKILDRHSGDEYWKSRQKEGRLYNFISTLENCSGKYVALIDGDDYWTDSFKLQKQVDFLDANTSYVLSYHDASIINEYSTLIQPTIRQREFKRNNTPEELIKFNFHIPTLSILFRNVISQFPPELLRGVNGDTFLISMLGKYGASKYQDDVLPAMHRHHSGGVWSLTSETQKAKNHITTLKWLAAYYNRIGEKEYADYYMQFLDRVILSFADSTTRADKYYQLGWKLGAPYRFIRKLFARK